ncbi:MAG: hypothetical protein A2017_20565 [Lentisphaerae bacterium GWF2_44_16]|nr:MAG: hypothetical protein A2017_20565 [Lentisphaerae bacterium GWF2_44_16]
MKILVTGSSGLLGSDIVFTLKKNNIEVIRQRRRPENGFIAADITTADGIATIAGLEWDAVIHSAALKDPDKCENEKDATFRTNVYATEKLAGLAEARKAKFIYISTDYVFPGTNPPYSEEDRPSPVNVYGESKLKGEEKVSSICKDYRILRVPILYGIRAGLKHSALLYSPLSVLLSGKECPMEDSIIRYPTYTGDVADAVLLLLRKGASGIYQFSGEDKLTKLGICKLIAEIFNLKMNNIIRLEKPPEGETVRPHDSHLKTDKIMSLGMNTPLPFRERLEMLRKEGFLKI